MAQYGRPISDVSKSNVTLSTGSVAYALLDETTASDTDYVKSEDNEGHCSFEVALTSTLHDPVNSARHYLRIRMKFEAGSIYAATVSLKQGATTIASWSIDENSEAGYVTSTKTLTASQANAITDYTALSVHVAFGSELNYNTFVSWIEFECPDGPDSGLEFGIVF
jgi:hypothetical protein